MIKEGGTGRKAAVQKAIEGLGGKLDSLYYTFGAADVIGICDMPDTLSGLALSLAVNASGAVLISTTPLLVGRSSRCGFQEDRELPTGRSLVRCARNRAP